MKIQSVIKNSFYSALTFFMTILVLSVGYGALVGGLSTADKVGSGSGLTATSWNRIIDGVLDLDSRLSNLSFSGGRVGIGTANPGAKLDVNGNINSTPILARYNISGYQLANTDVIWNNELLNTNSAYIQKNASGTGINILVSGYYQVNTKVLQYGMCDGCRGDAFLNRNGTTIGNLLGYGGPSSGNQQYFFHSFVTSYYFNAGDVITVNVTDYPIHPGTTLEIIKLN